MVSYIFKDPRDINGTFSFTYNIIDILSFYFPKGFVSSGNMYNTTTNVAGTALDGTVNGTLPTGAQAGAPPGRVLFIKEFIGHV